MIAGGRALAVAARLLVRQGRSGTQNETQDAPSTRSTDSCANCSM